MSDTSDTSRGRTTKAYASTHTTLVVAAQRRERRATRTREDADAGVRWCMKLMTSGQWVRGQSALDVAKKFSVSPETVKEWATSASRVIRLSISDDLEDVRTQMLTTLDFVISKATKGKSLDGKTTVMAIAEQAKILGLITQKHSVDLTVKQYEALEPAALLAKIDAQIGKLVDARNALLADHPVLGVGIVGASNEEPAAIVDNALHVGMQCAPNAGRCPGIIDKRVIPLERCALYAGHIGPCSKEKQ